MSSSNKDRTGSNGRSLSPGKLLMWLLLALSLLLNLLVINRLVRLQRSALAIISETRAIMTDLQDDVFALTVPIEQTIVLDTDLPIDEVISVPINTTVPIATEVTVTVNAGPLGAIPLTVPIETSVPVDLTVDIPISQTFAIRAPVEVDVDVPIEITLAETPVLAILEQVDAVLVELESQLAP